MFYKIYSKFSFKLSVILFFVDFLFLENFHSGAFYFPFPTLHLLTRHTHASGDNAHVGSVGNRWHMRPGAGAHKLDMPRLVYQALAAATSTRPGGNFIF
jgi:hypothetical protein